MTTEPLFAFCEPVWATPTSRVHIRAVGPEGLKTGGGIPTENPALCGFDLARGWDLPGLVAEARFDTTSQTGPTCAGCVDKWRESPAPDAPADTAAETCRTKVRGGVVATGTPERPCVAKHDEHSEENRDG